MFASHRSSAEDFKLGGPSALPSSASLSKIDVGSVRPPPAAKKVWRRSATHKAAGAGHGLFAKQELMLVTISHPNKLGVKDR